MRLFSVYGPRQRPEMAFHRLIEAVLDGEPVTVFGDGRQERDFTFVSDVVSILVAAAGRAEPGSIINVGGGSSVSVLETITILERLIGQSISIEHVAGPPGDARSTEASTERLRALGATVDVDVEHGLRQQVAWHLGLREVGAHPDPSGRRRSRKRRTVLLYSHDTYGLGHLRRNSAIAQALVNADPRVRVCLITGSPVADQIPMPPVELVRMPSAVKVGTESYRATDSRSPDVLVAERAGTIARTLMRIRPDVFLVDHSPLGMKGELRLALEFARDGLFRTRVVLGLRDVLDSPAVVRQTWLEQGVYSALDLFYDLVLVYGCRDLFDVTERYAFSPWLTGRTVFTGYVAKPDGLEDPGRGDPCWPSDPDGRIRILVMAGGGGDGTPLFESFIEAWPRFAHRARAVVVTGPLLAQDVHGSLVERAARLPGLQTLRFSTNMLRLIAGSDLVITMGGYNSVVETLAARRPMVIAPRVEPRQEQLIRAEILEGLGLARVVRLDGERADSLAGAVESQLAAGRPPDRAWKAVDLSGAEQVADHLLSLQPTVSA
jgi:predicted glycosyltransferase